MQEVVLENSEESYDKSTRTMEPYQKEGHTLDRHEANGQSVWPKALVQPLLLLFC